MADGLQLFASNYPTLFAWLRTLGWAAGTAVAAAIVYYLIWSLVARLTRARAIVASVLRFVRRAGCVVVVLLAVQIAWEAAPADLPRIAFGEHATTLALTIALAWLGVRAVAGLAEGIIVTHPLTVADNLQARRLQTQTRVLARTVMGAILFVGVALALMSFPGVRSIGTRHQPARLGGRGRPGGRTRRAACARQPDRRCAARAGATDTP
jgi:hypothetical protein